MLAVKLPETERPMLTFVAAPVTGIEKTLDTKDLLPQPNQMGEVVLSEDTLVPLLATVHCSTRLEVDEAARVNKESTLFFPSAEGFLQPMLIPTEHDRPPEDTAEAALWIDAAVDSLQPLAAAGVSLARSPWPHGEIKGYYYAASAIPLLEGNNVPLGFALDLGELEKGKDIVEALEAAFGATPDDHLWDYLDSPLIDAYIAAFDENSETWVHEVYTIEHLGESWEQMVQSPR
jgi:hypothetical protein